VRAALVARAVRPPLRSGCYANAFDQILSSTIPPGVTTRLYAGAIYDSDTGLYKIGARWYDPIAGVWLTPDAVVPDVNNPIAWNPYAFNYQNPVNYSDPSGQFPWLLAAGVFSLGGFGGHLAATAAGYDVGSTQWVASVGLGGVFAVGGFGLGYAGYGGWALAAGIAGDTALDTAVLGGPFWSSLACNAAINIGFDVAGYAIGRALKPGSAAAARVTDEQIASILPRREGDILVLGRVQREVDRFAEARMIQLGEGTYKVATRPLDWMSNVEQWAAVTGEGTWRAKVRDYLNFVSDAQQVARAKIIYQNTWDWRGSPFTRSEMAQTWLWGLTGRKEIIRFHMPWGLK
jgi:RHS repeat-associated protein